MKTRKTIPTEVLIELLQHYYPEAKCSLNFTNPGELLIATILSAQCTDDRVNRVTKVLFEKYKNLNAFASANLEELEIDIHSTGFYKNKAQNIINCCKSINDNFVGTVPDNLDDLISLSGVGRKTANVVMGNAFHKASGVVVDTHVSRLTQRMGLTRQKTPEKIEQDLNKLIPKKHWIQFSHWLILHGRKVCTARSPNCSSCFLDELCPKRI